MIRGNLKTGITARVTLLLIATGAISQGIMMFAAGNEVIELVKGAAIFFGGLILLIVREYISNGELFDEFGQYAQNNLVLEFQDEDNEADEKEVPENETKYIR